MKLFYTDVLKAAWMAREFGVQVLIHRYLDKEWVFFDNSRFKWSTDPEEIIELWIEDENDLYRAIHPDSYHIFEPQAGDTIRLGGNVAIIAPDAYEYRNVADYITINYARLHFADAEIIQRKGVAFFMPERLDE